MAIQIEMLEPGIIWNHFSNSWTMEELIAVIHEERRMATAQTGIVDVIADMSAVQRVPFDVGKAALHFLQFDWSKFGVWVVITRNGLVRRVVVQVVRHSVLHERVHFVSTAEEAIQIVRRKRAERGTGNHGHSPEYSAQT